MTVRRLQLILLSTLGLGAIVFFFRFELAKIVWRIRGIMRERKTVAERLAEYGGAVHERLLPLFEARAVPYPPRKLALIGLKDEKALEVWAAGEDGKFALITTYPILGASGRLGPKLREGDYQVPEGLYRLESLNPNSLYHLALRVNYPNDFDRERAAREGRGRLGGDIMIHGGAGSIGCLAMGDEAAEDLFVLAAETGLGRIAVILSPADFRQRELPELDHELPPWTAELYARIKSELAKFNR